MKPVFGYPIPVAGCRFLIPGALYGLWLLALGSSALAKSYPAINNQTRGERDQQWLQVAGYRLIVLNLVFGSLEEDTGYKTDPVSSAFCLAHRGSRFAGGKREWC
jgi:hypothetical protein